LRLERAAAYRAAVDAAHRQDAIDHDYARVEKRERETVTPAVPRTEAGDPERHLVRLENRSNGRQRPAEAAERESFQAPDETTAAAWAGSALGEHDIRVRERTSDFHAVAQLASGDTCHSVAKTTPDLIRDASSFEYPTIGTAADDVQTGVRGPASGREFDPEAAGGPIQQFLHSRTG
jgi:hypothetical protein